MAKLNCHRSDRETRVFRQGNVYVNQDGLPDLAEGKAGGHIRGDSMELFPGKGKRLQKQIPSIFEIIEHFTTQ